ncbi:TPA: hypothetical protein DEF17_08635 [bacterium]|nr:MAG: hypothetical protein AUJ18_04705 [Candidatus Hydrogenedentes bacterium CG1_02_42_14]PIU47426.1 MAG: hypothetical protein COS94_07400 [Candidatus Hydrogenedentes bacterium CG07_land_8_20_14_0_80_42_17]HBW47975.1 hypothetical protein [bacterium]
MFIISENIYEQLIQDGKKALPREAVGLIFGRKEGTSEITESYVAAENISSSQSSFEFDKKFFETAIASAGSSLIALFHTHPNDLPIPSRKDIDGIGDWTHLKHLILSFYGEPKLKVWGIFNSQIVPEPWRIAK